MSHPIESDTFKHIHGICMDTCIDCGVIGCGSRMENPHKDALRKNKINF